MKSVGLNFFPYEMKNVAFSHTASWQGLCIICCYSATHIMVGLKHSVGPSQNSVETGESISNSHNVLPTYMGVNYIQERTTDKFLMSSPRRDVAGRSCHPVRTTKQDLVSYLLEYLSSVFTLNHTYISSSYT